MSKLDSAKDLQEALDEIMPKAETSIAECKREKDINTAHIEAIRILNIKFREWLADQEVSLSQELPIEILQIYYKKVRKLANQKRTKLRQEQRERAK